MKQNGMKREGKRKGNSKINDEENVRKTGRPGGDER